MIKLRCSPNDVTYYLQNRYCGMKLENQTKECLYKGIKFDSLNEMLRYTIYRFLIKKCID